jgi:hypothetical protein
MSRTATSGQIKEVVGVLADDPRGFDIAQRVIESRERILEEARNHPAPAAHFVVPPCPMPFTSLVLDKAGLQAWMQKVYKDLGIACAVPPPPELGTETLLALATFGFRFFWIPELTEEIYPRSFVLPKWPDYAERRPLKGWWVAMETIAKSDWNDPAGYPNDTLAAALGLRRRFGVSWDALKKEGGLLSKVAALLQLQAVRLPSVEEWNFLANLFLWLAKERRENLPELGNAESWEWCENTYGSESRLIGGDRKSGGLWALGARWQGGGDVSLGFRLLADLGPLVS